MATLSQAKTLGGVGSILVFIPFVSIVGYILVIIAVKEISDDLHDSAIFNNLIIAAVTGIVGGLAGGFIVVGAIAAVAAFTVAAFLGVVTGLLVVWIALIISAVFLKRSYDAMGEKLGVKMFKTAATLYLVGAALTIVFVGFVLLLVAQILQAVAYFSIPDRPPAQAGAGAQGTMAAPPSMSPQTGATKFCASCGNKIAANATFCNVCGAKQP
jgi:uncharacterized membrane protein